MNIWAEPSSMRSAQPAKRKEVVNIPEDRRQAGVEEQVLGQAGTGGHEDGGRSGKELPGAVGLEKKEVVLSCALRSAECNL